MNTQYTPNVSLWLMMGIFLCILYYNMQPEPDPIPLKTESNIDVCMEDSFDIRDFVLELHIQEVKYPDIVLKQACLESSWFTSPVWRTKNNPFGFLTKNGYIWFKDYKSSIEYMKNWQDKYYKGGSYYDFLERLPYAEDSCYVETLKNMDMNNLKSIR